MLAARPGSSSVTRAGAVIAVLAFSLLALASHGLFSRVPVTLDGHRVYARAGATIADVAAEAGDAAPGDVLAVSDGRVVAPGGGARAKIRVNDVPADAAGLVTPEDVIVTAPGADIVEPTTEETRAIPIPSEIVGTGALMTLAAPGSAGVQRVVVGTVSGDIVASETVLAAEPMILRRVGDGDGMVVALTFDDGPWPKQTDALLKILAEYDVPATFFMVGDRVKKRPDLARHVANAGHLIGNHTYHHENLTEVPPARIRDEIAGTSRMISRATGKRVTWFRPPMGRVDGRVYTELKRQKLRPVLWTVDPQDWRDTIKAADIERGVLSAVRPGSVILLHDGGGDQREMLKALPKIIRGLRARGYDFVLLDDLKSVKTRW
ncbi:MAG: polysaccharide deacetylase family protein [Coriobacteriia bacterium]